MMRSKEETHNQDTGDIFISQGAVLRPCEIARKLTGQLSLSGVGDPQRTATQTQPLVGQAALEGYELYLQKALRLHLRHD